jgi:type I restriction enzyme S subunit
MTDALIPYPKHKDSGVPWLGTVPAHWEVLPHRALFQEVNERNHLDEPLLSVTIARGVIPQQVLLADSSKKDSSNLDKSNYKLVQPGDITYNKMRAWQGALGVSQYRGIVSPAYIVVRPRRKQVPRYYHYLFRTPAFTSEAERWSYGITSDQWSLRPEDFKRIYAVLPPLEEQTQIVRFLDHIDRLTRRYIRAQRRLIELLTEQKQALIQQAVTRGLDPDVPVKDSGVEWLGRIPECWNTIPVRRLITFITSGSRDWAKFYSEEGELFIQSGNLGRSMALDLARVQRVQIPPSVEGKRTLIAKGDILVCITGALTGNVAFVTDDLPPSYVNQHVALLRPSPQLMMPRFLAYALYSPYAQAQFKLSEYGGTKQGLGLDDVRDVLVLVPGKEEQSDIVTWLDTRLAGIVNSLDSVRSQIDLVREYRTRLIADVVTGKLDVRTVALPEPDEAGDLKPLDDLEEEVDDLPVEESNDADD